MRAVAVWLVLSIAPLAWAQTNEGLGIPKRNEQQIEAQKLSKLPKQTKFVEAEYPKEAAEQGIEAETVLLLDINAQGKVDSVSVAEPATPAGMGFDEAAMVAAQRFEFEPAELDGKPIAVQLSYRYKFKLKPKEPAAPAAPGLPAPGARRATAPAAPAREPVVNFTGLLRERGTRLPMPGVLVTVFREEEGGPKGLRGHHQHRGALPVLRPGARRVEGADRDARVLPLPDHRDHRQQRTGGRHLLRRAGHLQPVRRHRHRHPPAQGGQPHGAAAPRRSTRSRAPPAIRWRSSRTSPAWPGRRSPGRSSCAARPPRTPRSSSTGRRCRSSITSAACAA